jgi:hypothetical protein
MNKALALLGTCGSITPMAKGKKKPQFYGPSPAMNFDEARRRGVNVNPDQKKRAQANRKKSR